MTKQKNQKVNHSLLTRLLNAFLIWKNAARIRTLLAHPKGLNQAWPLIQPIFETSSRVYVGRVGPSARLPFQAETLMAIATQEGGKELLKAHLEAKNSNLVAYCVAGLTFFSKHSLGKFPDDLFEREEQVEWAAGCFFQILPLGRFADVSLR